MSHEPDSASGSDLTLNCGGRLSLRQNVQSVHAGQMQPEQDTLALVLIPDSSRYVQIIHGRPAKGDIACGQVARGIVPDHLPVWTDHLHLPHPIVRDVEVAIAIQAHSI